MASLNSSQTHVVNSSTACTAACLACHIWGLPLRLAPETLRPQLQAAVSTMEAENMVHSNSMPPTSLGIWEELIRRWEFKTSLTNGSARRSHKKLDSSRKLHWWITFKPKWSQVNIAQYKTKDGDIKHFCPFRRQDVSSFPALVQINVTK